MPDENVTPLVNPAPQTPPPVVNPNPVSPLPKKPNMIMWLVAIVVLVVVLGVGGYFLLVGKSNSQQSTAVLSVTPTKNLTLPLSPTVSAPTLSNQKDSLVKFSSPCMEISYPSIFIKDSDFISNEHRITQSRDGPIDFFGRSSLTLHKTSNGNNYNLFFLCTPTNDTESFADYAKGFIDDFNSRKAENTSSDKVEFINIDGVDAVKITRNAYGKGNSGRLGTILIAGKKGKYALSIDLTWTLPSGNNSKEQQEFEDILKSIKVIEIFK